MTCFKHHEADARYGKSTGGEEHRSWAEAIKSQCCQREKRCYAEKRAPEKSEVILLLIEGFALPKSDGGERWRVDLKCQRNSLAGIKSEGIGLSAGHR